MSDCNDTSYNIIKNHPESCLHYLGEGLRFDKWIKISLMIPYLAFKSTHNVTLYFQLGNENVD